MYTRPENIPVGIVWSRFQGKDKDGVPGLMYQIRDMNEGDKETCLDLLCESFIRDEPLNRLLGLANDYESTNNAREYWSKYIDQKMSIACYTEVDGKPKYLVGFNLLVVVCKNDKDLLPLVLKPQGETLKNIIRTLTVIETLVNVYEYFSTDTFLTSCALVVLPAHRGNNIGAKLLEAREKICETFGIKATCSTFTATSSQIAAARAGFEVLATMEYSIMLNYGIDLRNCESPCAKVMGKKYE
ncbi:uncharacterized protein LOC123668080 [Melitaea cinxia]|uniref:uncharacterized protein LOC123668080 n=1 Tax=Melitaea cinxia TaxID=113334 RepID=UPI001E2716A7|nr:uncharacterized protein LOC123668080 [Melitaea cinxia]